MVYDFTGDISLAIRKPWYGKTWKAQSPRPIDMKMQVLDSLFHWMANMWYDLHYQAPSGLATMRH